MTRCNQTMSLTFRLLQKNRSYQQSFWEISSWFWHGSVTVEAKSLSREWLRRFILLKVMMVLLFPNRSSLPLLVGCGFSLRALLLLRSPHISTKPSTVFLLHLASSDCLILLQWTLWLSVKLAWWTEKLGRGADVTAVWWREAVSDLGLQLFDAHHLASLLLLGLLGLEATLVSRWPQQTVRFRTSHWAHLSCTLVWMFVLLEFTLSLHLQTLRKANPDKYWSQLQDSKLSFVGLVPPSFSLSTFSPCLRKVLWLMNLRLHYALFFSKPPRRRSSFH